MNQSNTSGRRPDNKIVAKRNELAVLKLVRMYGHVRRSEIARAVWSDSSLKVATNMTFRTVSRLIRAGQLLQRPNLLYGQSLVLSARGASRLRAEGIEAKAIYEFSSIAGPRSFRYAFGTRYLIERSARGHDAYGTYALSNGWSPISQHEFGEQRGKIPDGLVLVPGSERGHDASLHAADWIEVPAFRTLTEEFDRMFELASRVGSWLVPDRVLLDRLLFIYNAQHHHGNVILKALKCYLSAHPALVIPLARIVLVRCHIGFPLVWFGHEEIDCARLLGTQDSMSGGGI